MRGDLYDWSAAPASVRGEPFQPAPLHARVALRVAGAPVVLERDAAFRFRDEAIGEIRRPVRAAPALDVDVEPDLLVWPPAQTDKRLEITLTSNAAAPLTGTLTVDASFRLAGPAGAELLRSAKRGERQFFDVPIAPPARQAAGRVPLAVAAVLDDGRDDGPRRSA